MTTATMRRPGKAKAWRKDGAAALWDAHREAPTIDTRNRLVEWYYPLVRYHARRVGKGLWGHVEADDLIGPGVVGLMVSIDRFDPARGIKFGSFATMRIVGEMRDELRRVDWRGRGVRARVRLVKSGREDLTAALGHEPTDEELVDGLGLDADEFRRAIADAEFRVGSMYRKVGSTSNGNRDVMLYHVLADERAEVPDAGLLRGDVRDLAYRFLSARQRDVLEGYYFEGLTFLEIGRRMGLSESRISQIHSKTINHIRERFADRLAAYIA